MAYCIKNMVNDIPDKSERKISEKDDVAEKAMEQSTFNMEYNEDYEGYKKKVKNFDDNCINVYSLLFVS